jgi:hypothetical protein
LDIYLAHSAFWTVGVCRYWETRSLGNCERKDVSYKENVNDNRRENIYIFASKDIWGLGCWIRLQSRGKKKSLLAVGGYMGFRSRCSS